MEIKEENVIILAKMALLIILMVFTFVILAMCERQQEERQLAKDLYKQHVGKTYVFGNDTISIDSNLNVKK